VADAISLLQSNPALATEIAQATKSINAVNTPLGLTTSWPRHRFMNNHASNTFQQRRQIFGDAFSSSSSSSGGSVRLLNQRKLAKLEHDANATPHDPRKQAELYKVKHLGII
jgi:hypothetical protein